jgi:hypothetical protein
MTETPGNRASTRRSSASTGTAAPEPARTEPAETSVLTAPTAEVERAVDVAARDADGQTAPAARTPLTLTIRLPFLTATLTGPGAATAVPATGVPAAAAPAPAPAPGGAGGTLEKLAFYGGVAAMGAFGALEWPVAAAVAAGTWVAQHTPPAAGMLRRPRPAAETQAPAEHERAAAGANA